MKVAIVKAYADDARIFRAGRTYDVDEATAEILIDSGFANPFGKRSEPETAAVEPPENAAKRTRKPRPKKAD